MRRPSPRMANNRFKNRTFERNSFELIETGNDVLFTMAAKR